MNKNSYFRSAFILSFDKKYMAWLSPFLCSNASITSVPGQSIDVGSCWRESAFWTDRGWNVLFLVGRESFKWIWSRDSIALSGLDSGIALNGRKASAKNLDLRKSLSFNSNTTIASSVALCSAVRGLKTSTPSLLPSVQGMVPLDCWYWASA